MLEKLKILAGPHQKVLGVPGGVSSLRVLEIYGNLPLATATLILGCVVFPPQTHALPPPQVAVRILGATRVPTLSCMLWGASRAQSQSGAHFGLLGDLHKFCWNGSRMF